jgi:hypothetical protein
MQHSLSSDKPQKAQRDQRRSLGIATLLSILLHALLAGGLATTSLGILPSSSIDNPTGTSIFKPKLAVDFPLEVPKSSSGTPVHEKPLDMSLPARRLASPSRSPEKRPPSRTVSPQRAHEPAEDRRADTKLPQRSAPADTVRPDAARKLDRSALAKKGEAMTKADTLAMKGEIAAAATAPRPAAATPPKQAVDRAVSSSNREPREVAMMPAAKPRLPTPTRPTEKRSDPAQSPRAANLSRRDSSVPDIAEDRARAESLLPGAVTEGNASGQAALRPAAKTAERRRTSSASQPPSTDGIASRELARAEGDAAASRSPAAAAAAVRSPRSDPLGANAGGAVGSPTSLTRSQVAVDAGDAAATEEVALPAGLSGSSAAAPTAAAEGGGDDGPLRPFARAGTAGRGRGDGSRAASGITSAAGSDDVGDDSPAPAFGGATGAVAATARGSRSAAGGSDAPSGGGGSGGALGRVAIAVGTADGDTDQVEMLAGTPAGSGSSTAGDGGTADSFSGATVGDGGPRPAALPDRRGPRGGGQAAISRGGIPVGPTDGGAAVDDKLDGLSTDGMQDALAAIQLPAVAAGGGGRLATAGETAAPVVAVAALPRATAIVLPIEGRVREIAAPFAKRAKENRDAQRTDSMVDRGLDFLRRAQRDDGRWSLGSYPGAAGEAPPKLASDTAATGLALLSFLGAGHDHFEGRHRDTVRRGIEFLLAAQKQDGDLFIPADPLSNSCAWLYSHGIATMALCEAVGMTGDDIVRPAAERACRFITASQHPERGGWRYTPRSDADLSVSGWMLVALRSGQLADVPIDPRTLDGVRSLLDTSAIATSSVAAKNPLARFHYNPRKPDQRPSNMSTACMNALGTLMRLHTGWKKTDQQVVANGRTLAAMRPSYGTAEQSVRDCYLWYYISQVLVHTGGSDWDSWYGSLDETLAAHQTTTGESAGSWDPLGPTPDRWGQYGGRVYVTTLHLLTLEVPYRHLPTYSFSD